VCPPVHIDVLGKLATKVRGHVQVMCWELLTGEKFYGKHAGMSEVVSALTGETQLPSERPLPNAVGKRLGAGAFRESIFSMLSRDAAARPSVPELLATWNSIFPHPGSV
jgi:hypothetical protein